MRLFVIVLAAALSLPASPLVVTGVAQMASASVAGIATSSNGDSLVSATVQLRDLQTGAVSGTATCSTTGSFIFPAVAQGNYVVEVLNAAGQVVGTSTSIPVAPGSAVTGVTVSASTAAKAARAARGTGVRTIVAVTTAAAAAGVAGVARRGNGDASPSR